MSERQLVSIVTPCLDPGERIERCLDSVAEQSYPNVEHLVIDGGSTDGTVERLRRRGVRFISEPDSGQAEAINKGFALAHGEWLGWLNADDVLTPHSVELAVAKIESTPGVGWAYGDCDLYLDGERLPMTKPERIPDARALEGGNLVPQPGSLIARWALDRIGPLDEELDLAMDFDLWLRLALAGIPSVHVPETLAVFELHDASKSARAHESDFRFEEALALLKRERPRSAVLMLGRAAAVAAQSKSGRIGRSRLDEEVGRVAERARPYAPDLEPRWLRAAAYTHAALRELHVRPRGVSYLLRPEPWLVKDTRALLARVLARGLVSHLAHPLTSWRTRARPPA